MRLHISPVLWLAGFGLLVSMFAWSEVNPELKSLQRKRLDAPMDIQKYPCAAGYMFLFADGELRECAVSRAITFGQAAIPKGSWINLRHDGRPDFVFLEHDTWIGGYLCKGGGLLGPTEGAMTVLYPDGKLRICWLAKDTVIEGVPCAHASMVADAFGGGSGTEFHENGRLKACKLSRNFAVGDHVFRQGDHIRLKENGDIATPF